MVSKIKDSVYHGWISNEKIEAKYSYEYIKNCIELEISMGPIYVTDSIIHFGETFLL